MTDQPRDWDKELANIDRVIERQPAAVTTTPAVTPPTPRRRFIALAWFWTILAVVLAVGLLLWPYDKNCGIRLIFFLGATLVTLIMAALGAFASWSHRQGVAMFLSLVVVAWAGIMAASEILPRTGYTKVSREWTCPAAPPAPNPAPSSAQPST
jgi:hypothetical protein